MGGPSSGYEGSVMIEEAKDEAEDEVTRDVLAKGDRRIEFGQVAALDEWVDAVQHRRERPDAQHKKQAKEYALEPVWTRQQRLEGSVGNPQRAAVEQVDEQAKDGDARLVSAQRAFEE